LRACRHSASETILGRAWLLEDMGLPPGKGAARNTLPLHRAARAAIDRSRGLTGFNHSSTGAQWGSNHHPRWSRPREVRMIGQVSRWLAALAAVALALGGCSLGPAYHRPSIPTPASWGAPQAAAIPTGWPSSDWWSGFH